MDTRTELLRAAAAVVAASGSRALTLEAVAAKAGVSKGGLLYHFPHKKALVAGMVEATTRDIALKLDEALAAGEDWLIAYVEATLVAVGAGATLAGVLSAVAEDRTLLAPFQKALEGWYRYGVGHYGNGALPLLLALDGLWFHSQIGTLPHLETSLFADSVRRMAKAIVGK